MRPLALAVPQALLFAAWFLIVVFLLKPAYCHFFVNGHCPYKGPAAINALLVFGTPFAFLVIDLILIIFVAPATVSFEIAEDYINRDRPKFLARWYSKVLAEGYSRHDT